MHRKLVLFAVLALLAAGKAGASVFATWSEVSIQFTNLGRAEASATATGLTTVTVTSSTVSHLETLSLGFLPDLSLNASIPVTDPTAAPITSVILTSVRGRPDLQGGVIGNISGAIGSTVGNLLPNTLPTTGGATICLLVPPLPPCVAQLNLDLGAQTPGGLFVGNGVGGILTIGGTGTIRISVVGAPFTVKTVSAVNRTGNGGFQVFTERGFAHGPGSNTSSTGLSSGVLQIVTANHIYTVAPGENNDVSGTISRTLLHFVEFVPEPDLLLLFGSGALGMALLGRKRIRRS